MNEHSSRSHAIFMVTVESCDVGQSEENHIVVGKLNLVDLAGSERQTKTGASGKLVFSSQSLFLFDSNYLYNFRREAKRGHQDQLVTFGTGQRHFSSCRWQKWSRPLPRLQVDSSLARYYISLWHHNILKLIPINCDEDSLGGNSRTVMVANIGPASYNYEETLTTLRYANRAKHIRNKPQINEDPKDALIRSFQLEIARLKASLINKKTKPRKKGEGLHDVSKSSDDWADDTEAELEQERKDILNNSGLIAEERDQLLQVTRINHLPSCLINIFSISTQTLQNKQEELHKKRENQEKLASRIEALESKLLTGHIGATSENVTIEDVTKKQQQTLEAHRQEIIEREVIQ